MNTIISLTTIPTRLPHIKPVIESLKVQGFPVHLWIPQSVSTLQYRVRRQRA